MMSIIGGGLSDVPGLSASLGLILVLTSLFATTQYPLATL